MSNNDILTVREVAVYLKVSERTVRTMIGRGELNAVKIGKTYRIRREDLEELVSSRSNEK